jgi:hypothetical protein
VTPSLADRILKRALAQTGLTLEEARRAFALPAPEVPATPPKDPA